MGVYRARHHCPRRLDIEKCTNWLHHVGYVDLKKGGCKHVKRSQRLNWGVYRGVPRGSQRLTRGLQETGEGGYEVAGYKPGVYTEWVIEGDLRSDCERILVAAERRRVSV